MMQIGLCSGPIVRATTEKTSEMDKAPRSWEGPRDEGRNSTQHGTKRKREDDNSNHGARPRAFRRLVFGENKAADSTGVLHVPGLDSVQDLSMNHTTTKKLFNLSAHAKLVLRPSSHASSMPSPGGVLPVESPVMAGPVPQSVAPVPRLLPARSAGPLVV
jgi:hypothetical protein